MSDTKIGASITNPSLEDTKPVDKEAKKAELDEEKAIGGKKGKNLLKKAGEKLAQPVKDAFYKDYGEDAVPTKKAVVDFVFDHAIKIGVAALTIGVTFAAARGKFNGFSKNFAENIKSEKPLTAVKNAFETVKKNNAEALVNAEAIKGARNIDGLTAAVDGIAGDLAGKAGAIAEEASAIAEEAGATAAKKGLADKIAGIIKAKPKEAFAEGSKIPKFVDKVCGKHADKVKEFLLKCGIGETADISDLALAASATGGAATGTGIITDAAVDKNDAEVGAASKLETVTKAIGALEKVLG